MGCRHLPQGNGQSGYQAKIVFDCFLNQKPAESAGFLLNIYSKKCLERKSYLWEPIWMRLPDHLWGRLVFN